MTLRKKTAELFDSDNKQLSAKLVHGGIITMIIVTVLSIILESVPAMHIKFFPTFYAIEVLSTAIFSIEYILRLWSAPESKAYYGYKPRKARLKYVLTPMAIIDLLAILPFLLSLFAVDLRFLRVIRLLRILKLTRYNSAINTLFKVLKNESRAFFSVVFVLVIILIIAASCIYLLEHKVQPDKFGSIPQSMWWAMVTLATVGYGDAVPVTPIGKLFGGIIMLIGIGIVALPAGILASAFSAQLNQNKSDYSKAVRHALRDGVITPKEYAELRALQDKYNLSSEDAEAIIHAHFTDLSEREKPTSCPHCGHQIHPPDEPE